MTRLLLSRTDNSRRLRYAAPAIALFAGCCTSVHAQTGGISSTAWYNIVNQESGKCTDAYEWATANGTVIGQWTCGSQQANQEWQLQPTSGGYYQIVNRNTPGKVVDVEEIGTANGYHVHLWQYWGGSNQQWMPVALGNGFYKFVGQGSGRCLDVPNASTSNGVQLWIYDCNGTGAQAFSLVDAAGGSTPAPTPVTIPDSPNVPAGYHRTFNDEFTSLSISDHDELATWHSNTVQCCLSDTDHPSTPTVMAGITSPAGEEPFSLIPGGGLDISLQKTAGTWYSGVLATADSKGNGFSQKYGYFEMKAKFPSALGTWPAFWMNSTDHVINPSVNPGEIDIMEHYAKFPTSISITLHDWSPGAADLPYSNIDLGVDTTTDYHLYGMLWTTATMTFYFDEKVVFTTPTPDIMQQPYYVIVDLGLGGGWPTTDTPAKSDLLIQYVRAYSNQ